MKWFIYMYIDYYNNTQLTSYIIVNSKSFVFETTTLWWYCVTVRLICNLTCYPFWLSISWRFMTLCHLGIWYYHFFCHSLDLCWQLQTTRTHVWYLSLKMGFHTRTQYVCIFYYNIYTNCPNMTLNGFTWNSRGDMCSLIETDTVIRRFANITDKHILNNVKQYTFRAIWNNIGQYNRILQTQKIS